MSIAWIAFLYLEGLVKLLAERVEDAEDLSLLKGRAIHGPQHFHG